MNREQAETLLAALVADELDEPQRGELLAYLKTDAVLSERVGDMRLAARLLREGLGQASADAPAALDEAQRAELLALAEREPIATDAPAASKSGLSPLFSIRVAGGVAACAALGVGLLGILLPEMGEARRTARRMQNTSPADEYAYDDYGIMRSSPEVIAEVPSLSLSDAPMLGDMPMLGGVNGTLRQDSWAIMVDRNEVALDLVGGTRVVFSDGRSAGRLLDEASGSLALGIEIDGDPTGYALARGEWKNDKGSGRGYWSEDDTKTRKVIAAKPIDPAELPAPPAPPAVFAPSTGEPLPDPVNVTGSSIAKRPALDSREGAIVAGVEGLSYVVPGNVTKSAEVGTLGAITHAQEWSGSVLWNDNHVDFGLDTQFDSRYADGLLNTDGQQGRQSGADDPLFINGRDSADLGGYLGQEQNGKDVITNGLDDDKENRYGDFAKDLGSKVNMPGFGQASAPDEAGWQYLGQPDTTVQPGGVTFSIDVPFEGLPILNSGAGDVLRPNDSIPDFLAFGPGASVPVPEPTPEPESIEADEKLPDLTNLRSELSLGLIEEESRGRRLADSYLRLQEADRELAAQLGLVPRFDQAPGFDLNGALSDTNSGGGGGGSGNTPSNGQSGLFGDQDKTTSDRIVDRKAAIAEYEQAMTKATAMLEKQDFLAANNAVIEARTILSRGRGVFESEDLITRVERAAQLQDLTHTTQARVDADQKLRIESERSVIESNIASETERRKVEEIQKHLKQARALQLEKNYDQALVELDAALFLEPDNPVLQGLRGTMQDSWLATESFELKRNRDLEIASQTLLNLEASTPFNDILTYPGDWPELTGLRLRGLENDKQTAQANAASRAALSKGVTIQSENMTLGSVIDHVRDSTGANVAVNWPALELAGVTRDTPVAVASKQVPAEQLLKNALDQAAVRQQGEQLDFTIDEGVVKISTRRDLRSETGTRVYDINAVLNKPSEASAEQRVAQIIERIKTAVGQPERWTDEDFTIQALNGNLIVRVTDEAHRDLVRVLDELNGEANGEAQQASPSAVPPVNPWVLTERDAQSTFALDTDTASYELARKMIFAQAKLPAIGSVRMEEFVNRFDYQYPAGRDAHDTFTVHAEAGAAPFAGSGNAGQGEAVLLKVGVRGRVVARDQMKPAHYVFVIDASGSMAREDRLSLVQRSLAMLLGQLGEDDTVSLVSYETRPYLLLEHASASDPKAIMSAAATIQTGGSTNLTDGLKLGYQVASRHFAPGTVNRVVLCSDGVANVGDDDAKQMLDAVKQYRKHGVTLMTVGVGVDGQTSGEAASGATSGAERYNDGLMEQLANRGDGQYVYLGSVEDAQRQFVTDLAATRPTIAYDAKIQVHFDPTRVRRYRLIGYENRAIADKDFRNDAVDAGEVGSGQSATALYEIELWPTRRRRGGDAGDLGTVYVRYRDARSGAIEETQTALTSSLIQERRVASNPRFYLAACAAEFAELLRQSEHAADGSYARLHSIAREVAEALPLDKDAAELVEMIGRADGLPRAGQ